MLGRAPARVDVRIMDDAPSRNKMVDALLDQGVLRPGRVETAMRSLPRAAFLDPQAAGAANVDAPQDIGEGQTISAPHMVAMMAQALDVQPGHRILEIGTGSGYHAAILARLAEPGGHILTIERLQRLADTARERLDRIRPPLAIEVRSGDGTRGAPDAAPFDRISVAAGGPRIPEPLIEQLAPGGRLVMPVGERGVQTLVLVEKAADGKTSSQPLGAVSFVPLIGEFGW